MTLIQMQYFQAVCRFENFTRAAEELHISQPAMSAAMKDLERECGVPLFIRDKNSLRITDEGQILLEEVSLVLNQYEHLNHIVKDLELSRKYIRIGLSTLSGNQVYPELLQEYSRRCPDIQVISVEESTKRQFEMLDSGLLDVIITIKRLHEPEEWKQFNGIYGHWPMKETSLVFCVGKENPLAGEEYVTMEQISKVPLILLKDNFSQTARIKSQFEHRGLDYQVMHYTNQMYTIERFAEKNIAAGFLPEPVASGNPDIVGIPYEDMEPCMIEVFWKKGRFLFSAARQFLEMVREMYPGKEKIVSTGSIKK